MPDTLSKDMLEDFVHTFYGYGNLHGQYWFVGMEEAGGKSFQEISQRLTTWVTRGKRELEDVAEFHKDIGITRLFSQDPKIQPTWGRLIRIVLGAQYKHPSLEQVKKYPRDSLGRLDGDTCLLELQPLPSPSTREWVYSRYSNLPYLKNREIYIDVVFELRITHLRMLIRAHKPKYVVFYGASYRQYWEAILGGKFQTDDQNLDTGRSDSTRFYLVKHPAARGITDKYFDLVGRSIAKLEFGNEAS